MVERSLSMREVPGSMPGISTFFPFVMLCVCYLLKHYEIECECQGDVAQMVERSLRMREVPGSMPSISTFSLVFFLRNAVCELFVKTQ